MEWEHFERDIEKLTVKAIEQAREVEQRVGTRSLVAFYDTWPPIVDSEEALTPVVWLPRKRALHE